MEMSKPVYIFLGGVSHTPVFFGKVIQKLDSLGYKAEAVAYPTCAENTEHVKQWDEVIAVQTAVAKQLDAGYDVVLVLHSYGGCPGSRAIKGLDKEERERNGHSTGIVEVVFLAAFLVPDNAPMGPFSYLPPWITSENGKRKVNESGIPLLFSDMDEKSQSYWFSQFAWQLNDFTAETIPDAPWHLSIPKTYIVTTNDKTATLEFQFMMLKGVMDESSDSWVIKSINSGHEPFLSQPDKLVEVILQPRLY